MAEKLKSCLAKALFLKREEIGEGASMERLAAWDSLAYLAVIEEVESAFGFKMTNDEMRLATSLENLEDIVRKREGKPV